VRTRRIALTILNLIFTTCIGKAALGLERPLYQFARGVPQEAAIEFYSVQRSPSLPVDSDEASLRAILATRPGLNASLTTVQVDELTGRESLPDFLQPVWESFGDQIANRPGSLVIGFGHRILHRGELRELAIASLLDSPFRRRLAAELNRGSGLALAWIAADDPEQDAILGQRIDQALREYSRADAKRQRLSVLRLDPGGFEELWTRRLFQMLCNRSDFSDCGAVAVLFGRGRVWNCIAGDELTAKQLAVELADVSRPVSAWDGDLPGVALPVEYVWSFDAEDRAGKGSTSHQVAKPSVSSIVPADAALPTAPAPPGAADWFVRALPTMIAGVMAVFFWAIFAVLRSR